MNTSEVCAWWLVLILGVALGRALFFLRAAVRERDAALMLHTIGLIKDYDQFPQRIPPCPPDARDVRVRPMAAHYHAPKFWLVPGGELSVGGLTYAARWSSDD